MLRASMKAAAAALGVALLATACGSARPGAAAFVGSERISSATLSDEVANLNDAYQSAGGKVQLLFPASEMPQQVLSWLVRFRVSDELGRRAGIRVSAEQSQRALAAVITEAQQNAEENGAATPTARELLVSNGVPPDLAGELGQYEAIQNAYIAELDGGKLPTSQDKLNALGKRFDHAQCLASKSLNIKINPQFGRLDYGQLSIVAAADSLSSTAPSAAKPSASPSAAPQLTPAC